MTKIIINGAWTEIEKWSDVLNDADIYTSARTIKLQVDGEPISRDDIYVLAVKGEASDRIDAVAPDWKQRNSLFRLIQLSTKDEVLTKDEQIEKDKILNMWQKINTVRETSDIIEASPDKTTMMTDDIWSK